MDASSTPEAQVAVIDELTQRAKEMNELWRQVRAGNVRHQVFDAAVSEWIARDGAAHRALDGVPAMNVVRLIAANAAQCQPYADLLHQCDPDLAGIVRPEAEVRMIATLFSELASLLPERIAQRILEAPQALQAVLSDPVRMRVLEADLSTRLDWMAPSRVLDVHASVASALGRPDATECLAAAQKARSGDLPSAMDSSGQSNDADDARRIADFIAANKGLLSWKISRNIREADAGLKKLLADQRRLQQLDAQVLQHLNGIHPAFIADVQAMIATELRRPDAADRTRGAAQLHRSGPAVEQAVSTPEMTVSEEHVQRDATSPAPTPSEQVDEAANVHERPNVPERQQESANNGFSHSERGKRVPVPVGDLLEHMTYTSRADGTVLYSVDQSPAFVDHGNQLLMVPGAGKNERAILGALLLAAEKYRGTFEITGTPEFTRQAIAVMLKYRIDAKLRNPSQDALLRSMERDTSAAHPPASADNPVPPVDPATIEPQLQAPATAPTTSWPPAPSGTADPLTGTVVSFGSAPYQHRSGNALSFYVTLENADGQRRTTWGLDLAHAVRRAAVNVGDQVILKSLGKSGDKGITPVFDGQGNFSGTAPARSRKVTWEIDVGRRTRGSIESPTAAQAKAPTDGQPVARKSKAARSPAVHTAPVPRALPNPLERPQRLARPSPRY